MYFTFCDESRFSCDKITSSINSVQNFGNLIPPIISCVKNLRVDECLRAKVQADLFLYTPRLMS